MIIVRFFTGVLVEYKDADGFRHSSTNGCIEILREKNVIASLQQTAGAIVEIGSGWGVVKNSIEKKNLFERLFSKEH